MRLAWLAENQIGDSGVTALAAALPQMPRLTTLNLAGTATRARCGFPAVWARASVVRRQLAPCALACFGVRACSARRHRHRRLGRHCAGGGAAADAAPHEALSRGYGHAFALRVLVVGACASVVGRQLAP